MIARGPGAHWGVLLAAGALYIGRHHSLLASPPGGQWVAPWPQASLPVGGLAPWLVLAGALVGGALMARLLAGAPFGVRLVLGAYACLTVPAHALEITAWLTGVPLFRPWAWSLAVWLTAGGLAAVTWRRGPEPPRRLQGLPPWLAGYVAATLAVAALHLHALARTIHHGARAWDGESYHLPVPLQWIHLESLTEPLARQLAFGVWGLEKFANPGSGHLLMAVPLLLGWDRLACVAQTPFLLVGAWGVFALARAAGGSPPAAAYASLAFVSAPIVAEQAAVPMHDLLTAALSLVAVAIVAGSADERTAPRPPVLVTAGLAVGLALATKTTAFSHLIVVVCALATSRWVWRRQGRPRPVTLALAMLAMALPAAFWYVRSARLFGNPVHPIRISGLTEGMTAEDMSGTWDLERMGMGSRREWLSFPFLDPEYSDESGFGALLVGVGVLGLAAGAADLARGFRPALTPRRRVLLLLVAALAVFWLAAARTPRFNLPLLGLAAAACAPALDALGDGPRRMRIATAALALAAVTAALSLRYHGWDVGPPEARIEDLEDDYPGIPAGIDALPPTVLYNDTAAGESSQPSNYELFGADHRHLVYDHPGLASGASSPDAYVARLKQLGAEHVFLRIARTVPRPRRYETPSLEPVLSYEGRDFQSTVYRVR